MSHYDRKSRESKRRTKREKIGFYTALSVCLIAVSMAVYSTYSTISDTAVESVIESVTEAAQANKSVEGYTVADETEQTEPESETADYAQTWVQSGQTEAAEESTAASGNMTALETMLSTDLSLTYPLSSNKIVRQYSEKSVYFKTLNVWKQHNGADFSGELGDEVKAMCGGTVTKVYEDEMYGKSIEISYNQAVITYSGLEDIKVAEADSVEAGDVIALVGAVPFEADEENHIHVSVKIGDEYADPLTFINNNE